MAFIETFPPSVPSYSTPSTGLGSSSASSSSSSSATSVPTPVAGSSSASKYFNLPHIRFITPDTIHNYEFSPLNLYKISEEDHYSEIFVSIYKLTYNDIVSYIPYYISDGHTNKLRANLLYPFICFNNKSEKHCASSNIFFKNVLFKYHVGKGIDMKHINTALKKKVKNDINILHRKRQLDSRASLDIYMDLYSKGDTIGITSVLPRWNNILDLLIGIFGCSISYFKDEINEIDRFIPCSPPNKFNMDKCTKPNNDMAKIEHLFRHRLVTDLHNTSNGFEQILLLSQPKYNFVKRDKMYIRDTISRAEFNKLFADMCTLDNMSEKQTNANNYGVISYYFDRDIKKQFDIIPHDNIISNKFKTKIMPVMTTFKSVSDYHNILTNNMDLWGMTCLNNDGAIASATLASPGSSSTGGAIHNIDEKKKYLMLKKIYLMLKK